MISAVLRFFDCFAWLIRLAGVDYKQFRIILDVKMTLDGRRQMSSHNHTGKSSRNTFAITLIMHAAIGGMASFVALLCKDPLVSMTIIHAFTMVMISMSLVADFTSVLLDTTDNIVLQPRPVSGRTLLAARVAHITAYLGLLGMALCFVPMIVGTFKYHWAFPLVFPATVLCSISLVVFLVHLFYLLAMRLVNIERFRDLIMYVQVATTIFFFGGYQLLPRLMDMKDLGKVTIDDKWWIYLFPPTWMAAPVDLLCGKIGIPQLVLSGLALIVPLAGLAIVVRVLSPGFTKALAALAIESSPSASDKLKTSNNSGTVNRLAGLLTRNRIQRSAFEMTWQLSARDRQFKRRVYPTFAILIIIPVIMIVRGADKGFAETIAEIRNGHMYLFALYMASAMMPSTLGLSRFSDNHEAGWIYKTLPLEHPGNVLIASLLVIMVRFIFPVFAILSFGVLIVWRLHVIPDIILAFSVLLFICPLYALVMARSFPFSEEFNPKANSGKGAATLVMMLIPLAAGAVHYAIASLPMAVAVSSLISLLLAALAMRSYTRTDWTRMAIS